jgi:hypothetical protein
MAGRDTGFRRQVVSPLLGFLAWVCLVAPGAAAAAGPDGLAPVPCAASGTGRVSASDRMTADLLARGRSRSALFDRLVNTIEKSDVIVVVMTRRLSRPAQLGFGTTTPYGRILLVTLTVPEKADRLIASLAHELQHALEIASDCSVVSQTTMERFYRQYGQEDGPRVYCTVAAQVVGRTVAREIGTAKGGR